MLAGDFVQLLYSYCHNEMPRKNCIPRIIATQAQLLQYLAKEVH